MNAFSFVGSAAQLAGYRSSTDTLSHTRLLLSSHDCMAVCQDPDRATANAAAQVEKNGHAWKSCKSARRPRRASRKAGRQAGVAQFALVCSARATLFFFLALAQPAVECKRWAGPASITKVEEEYTIKSQRCAEAQALGVGQLINSLAQQFRNRSSAALHTAMADEQKGEAGAGGGGAGLDYRMIQV